MLRYYESEKITKMYAKYRRGYSNEVVEVVMDYLKKKNNTNQVEFDLLVDVGCGSGQATKCFAPYFRNVIGFDVSANQLREARKANEMPHVTYLEGAAEKIAAPDSSVDMVISAKAAHWFDLPVFFKEVKRVLKKNGCLAIICTHDTTIQPVAVDNPGAGLENYNNVAIPMVNYICSGIYNEEAYGHILGGYRKIFEAIPSNDKERNDSVKNYYDWDLEKIVGYFYSVDSIQNFMNEKIKEFEKNNVRITDELIKSVDIVQQFRSEIREKWSIADNLADCDVKVKGEAGVFILMACHLE